MKSSLQTQPFLKVILKLYPGEAIPKKVAILEINSENKFRIDPIPLQSVRLVYLRHLFILNFIKSFVVIKTIDIFILFRI